MSTFVQRYRIARLFLPLLILSLVFSSPMASAEAGKPLPEPFPLSESVPTKVLKLAMKAYQNAKKYNLVKNPVLTIIDYSRPATKPRFWVLDPEKHKLLYELKVAHGRNSGMDKATQFSNIINSKQSSYGVFKTAFPYYGKHGYSLRLTGLEKGINDNAMRRAIVIHGGNYVTDSFLAKYGHLGRSWGCPVLDPAVSSDVINIIKNGSLIFAYYPDGKWLKHSRFLSKT